MYVAFAKLSITSVDAPAVPAPLEVDSGLAKRQHSSAEALFLVTRVVASRYLPAAMGVPAENADDMRRVRAMAKKFFENIVVSSKKVRGLGEQSRVCARK